ncbi:hypothetical protein DY000_02031604 [Brassica cretica]|uniref:Uncharacterized protein n=1 Tax=Brassica cretica TaxID=69181 RepID=A0ABQ7DBQ0_BRACR|nr:hypothetical protein DY000_02031604 [Brassica cretica]
MAATSTFPRTKVAIVMHSPRPSYPAKHACDLPSPAMVACGHHLHFAASSSCGTSLRNQLDTFDDTRTQQDTGLWVPARRRPGSPLGSTPGPVPGTTSFVEEKYSGIEFLQTPGRTPASGSPLGDTPSPR